MSTRPITGVIVAQNVTNAAAAGVTFQDRQPLSRSRTCRSVWILCDVYENDLPKINLGQEAQDQARMRIPDRC